MSSIHLVSFIWSSRKYSGGSQMPNSRPPMLWSLHGRALQRMRSRLEPRGHRIRYGGSGVCQCGSSHFSCDTHIVGSASLVICQGWGRGLFVIPLTLLIWFLTFLRGVGSQAISRGHQSCPSPPSWLVIPSSRSHTGRCRHALLSPAHALLDITHFSGFQPVNV